MLDSLLLRIQKHKHIYEGSDNPQLVQMWLVLLELAKSDAFFRKDYIKRMERILKPRRTEIMETIENY